MAPKPIFSSYLSFQFLRHNGMCSFKTPSSQLNHDSGEIFSEVTFLRPVHDVHLSKIHFNLSRVFSNYIHIKPGS